MREVGCVASVQGEVAVIRLGVRGGCGHCGMKDLCRSTSDGTRELTLKINGMNVCEGDSVEIETPARSVLLAAFLVFILPLILSITAYFIVERMTEQSDVGLIVFFIAFIAAEGLIAFVDRLFGRGKCFEPRIVGHVNKNEGKDG